VNWTVVFSLVLLGAIYFPTALWLKGNYEPPRLGPASVSNAKLILKLERPFVANGGHAFWAKAPDLESIADSQAEPERSPVLLYENDTLLGPAHSEHADISQTGGGLYSHWEGGIIFSSKNGEPPGPRGKTYWLVVPKEDLAVRGFLSASDRQDPPQDAPAHATILEPWASGRQPWPSGRQP
jgi:hypothetical protein